MPSSLTRRTFLAFAIAATLGTTTAQAQPNTGIQAVGLSRWSQADTRVLATELRSAGGNLEVAFLPFEFTLDLVPNGTPWNGAPWDDPAFVRVRELVVATLPRLNGKLTITTHLYFKHNMTRDSYQVSFRYQALKRNGNKGYVYNASEDKEFRKVYAERARRAAVSLREIYLWAVSQGLGSKIAFVTVPELEDMAKSVSEWENARRFVAENYAIYGVTTPFRRSVYINKAQPNGIPVEWHGGPEVFDSLTPGDTYSNDGTTIAITNESSFRKYLDKQMRSVQSKGISALFHRASYNGDNSSNTFPFMRRMRPWSDARELPALRRALRAR